jgi:hypothetical protein
MLLPAAVPPAGKSTTEDRRGDTNHAPVLPLQGIITCLATRSDFPFRGTIEVERQQIIAEIEQSRRLIGESHAGLPMPKGILPTVLIG